LDQLLLAGHVPTGLYTLYVFTAREYGPWTPYWKVEFVCDTFDGREYMFDPSRPAICVHG